MKKNAAHGNDYMNIHLHVFRILKICQNNNKCANFNVSGKKGKIKVSLVISYPRLCHKRVHYSTTLYEIDNSCQNVAGQTRHRNSRIGKILWLNIRPKHLPMYWSS